MIQLYIGDGKGKTTASIGLSIRAAGQGFDVLFIQFLKDDSSGEIHILKNIPGIKVLHCPINYGFLFQMTEEQKRKTAEEYDIMLNDAMSSNAAIIVLDEVVHALNAGLISQEKLEKIMNKKSEIILTGRDAPDWLIQCSDYVSEIKKIKHPYDHGVQARIGIEF